MIRAGVLVASYRFKVLSLDAQGRQYLIMMDLLRDDMADMKRLEQIESMIVQAAKARHDLVVTGVYWRNDVQTPMARPPSTVRQSSDVSPPRGFQRDEIDQFKQSIKRVAAEKSGKAAVASSSINNQDCSPEFEDTRITDPIGVGSQLSATQYGDLE